ncbi:MAG: hypothetical protein Q8L48_30850 [Archangium sp.]|nr:hypothetical protein [Archangium sp.]
MSLVTSTNGLNAVKKSVEGSIESAKETIEVAAHEASKSMEKELGKARRTMSRVADKVEKTAIANPLVTAGVLVGAGALLGALLHAALRPAPTAGDLIMRSLKESAARTGDTLSSGLDSARRAMR